MQIEVKLESWNHLNCYFQAQNHWEQETHHVLDYFLGVPTKLLDLIIKQFFTHGRF